MRKLAVVMVALAVQGCSSEVPLSNSGYQSRADAQLEQRLRDNALRGTGTGPGISYSPVISTESRPAAITTQPIGTPIATATPTATAAGVDADRSAGVQASPSNAVPVLVGNNGAALSDEQSFDAVTSRETIESDAERRAQQAAAYQVVQPGALPTRGADTGPNIVDFALSTTNRVGQKIYSRFLGSQGRMQRACAGYPSADAAQRAFLAAGGPRRDRKGMDPDGDGFACAWDPSPYRAAAGR